MLRICITKKETSENCFISIVKFPMTRSVRLCSVGLFAGWSVLSVIILHFHAPIGALVFQLGDHDWTEKEQGERRVKEKHKQNIHFIKLFKNL